MPQANESRSQERSKDLPAEIQATICGELQSVNHDKLTLGPDTDITTDLQVDSLVVMDLVFALEERFDISVPMNELSDIRTIAQLRDKIYTLIKEQNAA